MRKSTFDYIQQLLLKTTAISLDTHKYYLVEARLTPLAKRYGAANVDQLVDRFRLKSCPALQEEIVNAMTTNETFFFRDGVPFETLRTAVLPQLFRTRIIGRQISIWSAACSTGQELYSVAMVLREYFPDHQNWDVRLIGSDLSTEVIKRAEQGLYSDLEARRGLPEALRQKYLQPRDNNWQIVDELRSMVEFRHINLIRDWPRLPKMDVVFLRNVMVYWDEETKRQVLRRVRAQMKPDGYLFLGGAETTVHLDRSFVQMQGRGFSYYRLRS